MGMTKEEASAFARQYRAHMEAGGTVASFAHAMGMGHRTVHTKRAEAEVVLGISLCSKQRSRNISTALSANDHAELVRLRARQEEVERLQQLYLGGLEHVPSPPEWTHKLTLPPKCLGTPTLFLSDLHWGEVVDPRQINGVNEYNLPIARSRLKRIFQTTLTMLFAHLQPGQYPGIVVALGGDMVSGNIHEELRETNDASILATILDLLDCLIAGIDMLLDAGLQHVFIPCVVGNHGRLDKKPRAKGAVQDNYEWILYQLLLRHYAKSKRVTVVPSDSLDFVYQLHATSYLLTHGDQFRGGSGIAGPFTPWALGDHKKRKRQNAVAQPYDYMIFGHFHTLVWGPSWIVNGCFPAGSNVVTPLGVRPIEQIAEGDTVLSRDGSYRAVTATFRKASEHGLVHLKVRGLPEPLSATPNHLIWALKGESRRANGVGTKWDVLIGHGDRPQWIPADFISPGDYVHVPRHVGSATPVDAETAWAYGLFIAEGSVLLGGGAKGNHHRITLTMHEREIGVLHRWAAWFEREYGIAPRVYHRKRAGMTSELVVSPGREVCVAFREMFGHRARGKHVPDGALDWHPDLCRALVTGWIDGDGHTTGDGVTSATTVSPMLAHQMFRLALSAGMMPSLSVLRAGGNRKSDAHTIHFNVGQEAVEIDGELFYRVSARYRDREVVPVFDLEVAGEHTYTVGHVGVHNSLKGYDEYSFRSNFGFEVPQQALWITHPRHGITIKLEVQAEDEAQAKAKESGWVRVRAGGG